MSEPRDISANLAGIPMPANVAALPVCPVRKIPVPWFVAWIDGKPEFRAADAKRKNLAIRDGRCWVCGVKRHADVAFLIGPMCSINRVTAEPPCHYECAVFSARACPFLARPNMERRESNMPAAVATAMGDRPGHMITRNPGVTCLWRTSAFNVFRDGNKGELFRLWPPWAPVEWWCQGRAATRAEVVESIESGLPLLRELCGDNARAIAELDANAVEARKYLPPEVAA